MTPPLATLNYILNHSLLFTPRAFLQYVELAPVAFSYML